MDVNSTYRDERPVTLSETDPAAYWTDTVIQQGHADYCAEYGHAESAPSGRCGRCGDLPPHASTPDYADTLAGRQTNGSVELEINRFIVSNARGTHGCWIQQGLPGQNHMPSDYKPLSYNGSRVRRYSTRRGYDNHVAELINDLKRGESESDYRFRLSILADFFTPEGVRIVVFRSSQYDGGIRYGYTIPAYVHPRKPEAD